jgi:hypothetical protein
MFPLCSSRREIGPREIGPEVSGTQRHLVNTWIVQMDRAVSSMQTASSESGVRPSAASTGLCAP